MKPTTKIQQWVIAFAVAAFILGCETVPETGRSQLILVGSGDAMRLGITEFEKLKKATPVSKDSEKTQLVTRVGGRIAQVADLPDPKWEFVLFDKPDTVNAFALPGGKVGIYSGILPITKTEAGLATVMAHEVAHVAARHGSERISQGLLLQLGGVALAQAASSKPETTQQIIHAAYGIGGTVGVMLPHSRNQELEADEIGLLYMARAGYDPKEAVEFWKRFGAYNAQQGRKQVAFLSTHPLDEKRVSHLESLLPKAMEEYKKAKGK